MAVKRLTDDIVEAATGDPRRQQTFLWDKATAGLGLRITGKGRRSWVYRYSVSGGDRRMTLGAVAAPGAGDNDNTFDLTGARAKVAELAAVVDRGGDPAAPAETGDRPTLTDLWKRFEAEHLPKRSKGHQKNLRDAFARLILPKLGAVAVEDLDWSDVDAWHQSLAGTPTQGNRALAALRKALNLARRWGWLPPGAGNPATDHDAHPERKAGRPFSETELKRIGGAVGKETDPVIRRALLVTILTGLRPGEVCGLKWTDLDEDGILRLEETKTGQRVAVLPTRAESLILELPAAGEYVFPGRTEGEPLGGEKGGHGLGNAWKRVRVKAKLPAGRRLYDARHTWISTAAGLGIGDDVRRVLAGHSSGGNGAHSAYLHATSALREAADKVAERLAKRLGLDEPEEAVSAAGGDR